MNTVLKYMVIGVVIWILLMFTLMLFGWMSEVGPGYLVAGIPIIAIPSGLFGLWMEKASNKKIIIRNGFLTGIWIGVLYFVLRMTQGYLIELDIFVFMSIVFYGGGGGIIGGMLGGFLNEEKFRKKIRIKPYLITASIGAFIVIHFYFEAIKAYS